MRYGLIWLEAIGIFLHSGCLASAKLQKEAVIVGAQFEEHNLQYLFWVCVFKTRNLKMWFLKTQLNLW
jgi:hypothetical protein